MESDSLPTPSPTSPTSPTASGSIIGVSASPRFQLLAQQQNTYRPSNLPYSVPNATSSLPSSPSVTNFAQGPLTLGPGNQIRPLPSILTPSGRAFARGGRVRNVSPNPLAPCVIYWPDNEDLPLESQVRPTFTGTVSPFTFYFLPITASMRATPRSKVDLGRLKFGHFIDTRVVLGSDSDYFLFSSPAVLIRTGSILFVN